MAQGISVPSGRAAARGSRGSKPLLALRGDDHLVERIRRGDEAAFEVAYERHVHGLLSFCRHMLGSQEEAEDAVQQAFTAAHRDLLRGDREIRLKAWLYTIARNRCLSMLRARREQPDERVETSTEGLDKQVEQRADLRELLDDLNDLPEDQRAALLLMEMRDLSHADVAEVLGCKVANVKGLVFRARAGLSERREARNSDCAAVQQELAVAYGGTLRRGTLRHHLRSCAGCSDYLQEVRRQRQMVAMILPVVPSLGLKSGVLAAVGIGGGAAGGGGAAAGGGGLLAALLPAGGATVAKVAVVGALAVGGGGVVGEAALNGDDSPASPAAPSREGADRSADSAFDVAEPAEAAKPKTSPSEAEGALERREVRREKKEAKRTAQRNRARAGLPLPVPPRATPNARGGNPPESAPGRSKSVAPPARRPVPARPRTPALTRPSPRVLPPQSIERPTAPGRRKPLPAPALERIPDGD